MRIRGRLAPSLAVIPHREPETDDAALIAAARAGDGAAFARLFRRHADAVRTRITRLVGPVAERDDLVQKVFIAFYRALPGYRGEAKLSTFLHRIAVNTAYDHLRGRQPIGPTAQGPHDAEALVEQLGPALEDQVAARADLARLLALLDQLSPKKRIAFILVAVEGCSLAEAAALIGAAEDTVKQRALHARRDLLARLAAHGEAATGAAGGGRVVIGRRDAETGAAAESEELERLCDRLGRVEAPFDEITRSRAEARLVAELARRAGAASPARAGQSDGRAGRRLGARRAGGALVARPSCRPAGSRVAGRAEPSLRFEPYVVAPTGAAGSQRGVGRAGGAGAIELAPRRPGRVAGARVAGRRHRDHADRAGARVVRARASQAAKRTVVHLEQGRLLASLEGGAGRRLEIVSPGAVTDVVGHALLRRGGGRREPRGGRARTRAGGTAPGSSGAPPRAVRDVAAGESWLTTLPEPDALEPALAEALADHERTPPPRGATVPLSVTEAPAGAGVWVGKRRIASAPAWVLVESHAAVRLSAPARPAAPPVESLAAAVDGAVDRAAGSPAASRPGPSHSRRRARPVRPVRARRSRDSRDPAPRRPSRRRWIRRSPRPRR